MLRKIRRVAVRPLVLVFVALVQGPAGFAREVTVEANARAGSSRASVTVEVEGFVSEGGQLVLMLYRQQDIIGQKPYRQFQARIRRGKATLNVVPPGPGRYALIAYHDENGNQQIDHNWLRVPSEPMAFSGGFEASLFSGKPTFDDLAFAVRSSPVTLRLRVAGFP